MKRIATTAVVLIGLAIPSVGSAASSAQATPQATMQIVQAQLVKGQRANLAVVAQRVGSQRAQALRFSWQLGLLRR